MSEHILEKCPLKCNQNQNCIFFNRCKRYKDYRQGRADEKLKLTHETEIFREIFLANLIENFADKDGDRELLIQICKESWKEWNEQK